MTAENYLSPRDEIRDAGLACPSCGKNYGDLIGRHNLILAMEGDAAPWSECADGTRVLHFGPAVAADQAWEKIRTAANIAAMDDTWFRETMALKEMGLAL